MPSSGNVGAAERVVQTFLNIIRAGYSKPKDIQQPMVQDNRFVVITPDEKRGSFIVAWVAHHLVIGANEIVAFSNDCTDGSDALLDQLAKRGYIKHIENMSQRPRRSVGPTVGSRR
jgi:hypothetical protein